VSDLVLVDVTDGIALVTLNRPEARNALSSDMLSQLVGHMTRLDARADVDVLVLTGAGPAFCAGLDLKEMAASGANIRPADGRPWPELAKPLIGAVNGAAVTGGLELALACDFLIASERARFADTHTRVGLVPFWGMSVLLPQAVGVRVAREMSLTGNFMDAEEARRVGLVNRVVPHDDLLPVAMALAADIASAEPAATRVLVSEYRSFSGGGPAALAEEVRRAEAFLGAGIDPVLIEQRRIDLLERARRQAR
jgi:enoyl-CoA hydratase